MNTAEPLVPEPRSFQVEIAIKVWENKYFQVLNKFWQTWSKQDVIHYVLKFTSLLILFGVRKTCHSSGRNLLLFCL